MSLLSSVAPALIARARADQVATLYSAWHLTTLSMGLGALILCAVMWDYMAAGARVVSDTLALWQEADIVLKVRPPECRMSRGR